MKLVRKKITKEIIINAESLETRVAVMENGNLEEFYIERSSEDVKTAFCPVVERWHADVVFTGHDHGIARTYAIKNGVYGRRPSQGTIYYVTGRSGGKTYRTLIKKPWDTFFYNPLHEPNYLVVQVAGARLTIIAVSQDGTVLDTFFIDKKADVDSDTGEIASPRH